MLEPTGCEMLRAVWHTPDSKGLTRNTQHPLTTAFWSRIPALGVVRVQVPGMYQPPFWPNILRDSGKWVEVIASTLHWAQIRCVTVTWFDFVPRQKPFRNKQHQKVKMVSLDLKAAGIVWVSLGVQRKKIQGLLSSGKASWRHLQAGTTGWARQ